MTYFAPNQPEYNYLKHMLLVGWDGRDQMDESAFEHSVAHHNAAGQPDGWFFDSFLIFSTNAPSGNALHKDINLGTSMSGEGDFFAVPSSNPANKADWRAYLDAIFRSDNFIPVLDRTVARMRAHLGAPPHKRNVVVSIPYPHQNQTFFHREHFQKPWQNFSVAGQNLARATRQRLDACKWFVDEIIAAWEKSKPGELHLLGFYWPFESIHYAWDVDDHWLLKELYRYIRERGYSFFWVPFYSSFNVHLLSNARGFYFDCGFLQPNYMFYQNIKGVGKAANEAKSRGAGVELEYYLSLDENTRVGREKHQRFREYLKGGIEHGYMTESACAYFIGCRDLAEMCRHENPVEREIYNDLFRFVQGRYVN